MNIMSGKIVGTALLLVGSELLGLVAGEWFFKLFVRTVPPLAISALNQSAAHIAFISYGALFGLVIFLWSLAGVFLAFVLGGRRQLMPG